VSVKSKQDADAFFHAVTVVQRFVCAFQAGYLLRPSLSQTLQPMTSESDRLALDGLLFTLARRLDRRGELSVLVGRLGLPGAIETLARRRLREHAPSARLGSVVGRLRLSDIAHDRRVSTATLRRRIRAAAGMTPRELRRRQKVWCGLELIRSGMKIESAATDCGYRSERSFYAAVRALTGMTPASIRGLSHAEAAALEKRLLLTYQSVGL
jgi:AraC-like DNA-binding protein